MRIYEYTSLSSQQSSSRNRNVSVIRSKKHDVSNDYRFLIARYFHERNPSVGSFSSLLILVGFALCSCSESPESSDTDQQNNGIQTGEAVLSVSIGSDPDQLGYQPGDESASQGPSSFAMDDEGRFYILDPVKARIQVYDGDTIDKVIPLPSLDAQDIRLLPNGDIVLLDAWTEGKLFVIDYEGSVKSVVSIEGIGLPIARSAGKMLVRPDGVWIKGRRRLVRVMDSNQQPDVKRPILPAEDLSKDGKWLVDYEISGVRLTIIKRERDGVPKNRIKHLYLEQPMFGLVDSGFDDEGRIYIATLHETNNEGNPGVISNLIVLSQELEVARQTEISQVGSGPDNLFRSMEVASTGDVYLFGMADDQSGSVVRRFR